MDSAVGVPGAEDKDGVEGVDGDGLVVSAVVVVGVVGGIMLFDFRGEEGESGAGRARVDRGELLSSSSLMCSTVFMVVSVSLSLSLELLPSLLMLFDRSALGGKTVSVVLVGACTSVSPGSKGIGGGSSVVLVTFLVVVVSCVAKRSGDGWEVAVVVVVVVCIRLYMWYIFPGGYKECVTSTW